MAEQPLFDVLQLTNFLGHPVSNGAAEVAERVVWGWLKPVLGLAERPDPAPPEVFSWALELGGIAHENPAGRSYYELGDERSGFSAERRAEILTEAGTWAGGTTSGPLGSFPDPPVLAWPDPIRWNQ